MLRFAYWYPVARLGMALLVAASATFATGPAKVVAQPGTCQFVWTLQSS
jgi:hypothetical protein